VTAEDAALRSTGARRPRAGTPFPRAFYDRRTELVARDLLGAVLECHTPDGVASGRIVETEAYLGPHDPACHAVAGLTPRTRDLHGPPGMAYVYRIYGMYWCFNAVTEPAGVGAAVLVRALEPLDGIELMWARRRTARRLRDLASGPGKLCTALGVDGRLSGGALDAPPLRLLAGPAVADDAVTVTPRIGITRAADWPLRYLVADSEHVSRTPRGFAAQRYSAAPFAPPRAT
jgi:DNA-3-methyladenine glycosylase